MSLAELRLCKKNPTAASTSTSIFTYIFKKPHIRFQLWMRKRRNQLTHEFKLKLNMQNYPQIGHQLVSDLNKLKFLYTTYILTNLLYLLLWNFLVLYLYQCFYKVQVIIFILNFLLMIAQSVIRMAYTPPLKGSRSQIVWCCPPASF